MKIFIPIEHSLKYNPSLDGLRGVAILLVLLFHIWPEYFSFGYVGVDIFFVLSGFLITQIIYTKLESNTFSFKEFYRNRIRRIFPALIIVLLFTILIGYIFLLPFELKELGFHIKSSAFFYENFRLIKEVGYWDEASQLKPLLHFWSLSIEEQFYLLWPTIVFVLYKYRLKLEVWHGLLIVFAILILLSFFLDINKFYHTISRSFELVLGGIFFVFSCKFKNLTERISNYKIYLYVVFLLSILYSFNNTNFNFLNTFCVAISTSFLILYLSFFPKTTLLNNKFLIFFGLISFPLYLWHYVIISYGHIFGINVSFYGILIIFVSVILSFLVYYFIEIQARKQTSYIFSVVLLLIVVCIGLFGNFIKSKNGFPLRAHLVDNSKFEAQFIRDSFKNDAGILLVNKALGYTPTSEYIKATSDDITKQFILITGDSHAHTSYPGIQDRLKTLGYETLLVSNSSCPPYLGGAMGKNIDDIAICEQKIKDIYNLLNNKLNILGVIFITRANTYMYDRGFGKIENNEQPYNYHHIGFYKDASYNHKDIFLQSIDNTFAFFNDKKIKFFYLIENPELGFSPRKCLKRPFGFFDNKCTINFQAYVQRSSEYRNFILEISKKYNNVVVLDPLNMYCDQQYCYAIKDGVMLYADDDHHSVSGSYIQADYLIKNIILNK
ncbi:acyltransferase family protein [Campylobacter gastrosuis]|uniref:Acyltransferase n=1 Tax=Campylobacter gastrosuis TaxID=2974576 RepID=A0ABT7HN30_9BACT|nr:acyltransferase family protein [Campylobacter gastrosuis]MDL0088303.1 acyltransferase [Campylobacter gastrosuis]